MLKIYGNMMCKDCVECREALDRSGIEYEFLDFSDSLLNLKEFLHIRDTNDAFSEIRGTDMIGIPCFVSPDGSVSLDWTCYVSQDKS